MRNGIFDLATVTRAAVFVLTGTALSAFWIVARPSREMTDAMREWPQVIWFSATLLTLAVALPIFGRMVGGARVVRLATIAGLGPAISSFANVLEDGFRIDAAFFLFISGTLILDVALLALTIELARRPDLRTRMLAAIPAGALAGILLFVEIGGPVMLVTWLGAAAAALWLGRVRTPAADAQPGAI
jgi:hypothetical protein